MEYLKAISIRQPWAWLILNAGKDVENRTWPTHFRGRVLIHAGATMTRGDYEACAIFVAGIYGDLTKEFLIPDYEELKRECGGIVGGMEIVDCVRWSPSPWFVGDYGFVLRNARALPFVPCKGALNFFRPEGTL